MKFHDIEIGHEMTDYGPRVVLSQTGYMEEEPAQIILHPDQIGIVQKWLLAAAARAAEMARNDPA